MSRLTFETCRGIWAALPMCWDEKDRFDEASYRANVERICQARPHGVYTTGSTGEFYAIDFDEFRRMVDIQAEICGEHGMLLQIGCCAKRKGGEGTRSALLLFDEENSIDHSRR